MYFCGNFGENGSDPIVFLAFPVYFFTGMDNGSVVAAAEEFTDFWQGPIGHFPAKIHGQLPRNRDVSRPSLGNQIVDLDSEVGGDNFLNSLRRDLAGFVFWKQVL